VNIEKIGWTQKSSSELWALQTAVFLSPANLGKENITRKAKAHKRMKGLGNAQEYKQQEALRKMSRK